MSLAKNGSIRCDGCGKLSRTKDGYYRRPDGTAGYIRGQAKEDYCDECAGKTLTPTEG